LSAFRLQPDGKLSPVGDAAVTLEGQLRDLRVDHRGAYVYVLTEQPNRYLSFAIDAETGRLRADKSVELPADSRPKRIVASPEERLSFVLDEAGRRVFVHRYITSDAAPLMYDVGDTYGSPLVTSESPQDMVVDPTGLNGLLLDKTGGLTVYRLPGVWGPLKSLGKGPVQAGKQPVAVTMHPRGGFVYVADAGTSTLRQFRLDADSGELTPSGEPVTLLAAPAAVDIDPSGRFAYVRYAAKPGLTRFVVDPQSGRLEQPRDLLDVVSPKGLAITTVLR
jgi:DNA-binding beta-propeller fold protein YncE